MNRLIKRLAPLFLAVVLVLSAVLSPLPATAQTGTRTANTGTRGEACTSLSDQALSYYAERYTWDVLSQLDGGTSSCLETDNALFSALHDLMESTMTQSVTYTNLKQEYPYSDAIDGNTKTYGMFYSGELNDSVAYKDISREHVWPKKHASFHKKNGGCDLHHLRPEIATVNSTRSDYILGNVKDVYPQDKITTPTYNGNVIFYLYTKGNKNSDQRCEIPDRVKGDVARILLYVWCRWEQPNLFMDIDDPQVDTSDNKNDNRNDGVRVIESLETLLQWCAEDPVDTWEMGRNDAIELIQGNRNVFIDYPEYAWLLFGQEIPDTLTTPTSASRTVDPDTCTHTYTSETVAPTCAKQGYTTYVCTLCKHSYTDSYVEPTGKHTYGNWKQTVAPTLTQEGQETQICVQCGDKQVRAIAKLPDVEQTLDGLDPLYVMYIAIAVVAVALLLLIPHRRNKKRREKK